MDIMIMGRIDGLDIKDVKANFLKAKQYIGSKGHGVTSPFSSKRYSFIVGDMECAEIFKTEYCDYDFNYEEETYLKEFIKMLLECDCLYLLKGYAYSRCAIILRNLAMSLGIGIMEEGLGEDIYYYKTDHADMHPVIVKHKEFAPDESCVCKHCDKYTDGYCSVLDLNINGDHEPCKDFKVSLPILNKLF